MDDILGEESDNESEGRGKDKPGNEEVEDEDEEQQQHHHQQQLQQQQPGAGHIVRGGLGPQVPGLEERIQTPSSEASLSQSLPRWDADLHCNFQSTHYLLFSVPYLVAIFVQQSLRKNIFFRNIM